MRNESLCIRAFAEVLRLRMNKKAQIKNFDPKEKRFQYDAEVKNSEPINLSGVFNFYKLLLDAVIYLAVDEGESGIPDINPTMATELKNGNWEINDRIKEIAQRDGMKVVVSEYFEVNLIPNIPKNILTNLIGDINGLMMNSTDVGKTKKEALKQAYKQKKSNASYLAEIYLFAICNGTNRISNNFRRKKSKDPSQALDELEASINRLSAPAQITPPEDLHEDEQTYICELHAAYGEREGIIDFCEIHLAQYEEYKEDREDRRIDYFAAESVRQGIRELQSDGDIDQFTILKEETLAGVKNTARKSYPDGYEKMLSVMEQAAIIQVTQYTLCRSPNWISNRIKMGVCHFLVNENKLKWVKK